MPKKRISGYIESDLHDKIDVISAKIDRSFNKTLEILLEQAIKERERQNAKNKNRTVHNSADPR